MSVSNEFKKIVADESILNAKVLLKQYALIDESLNMFNDAFKYAKDALGDKLIEAHNGKEFKDYSDWDEDYAMDVASALVFNFSQERVNHMREVFKKVYPNAKPYEEGSPSHISSNGSNNGKVISRKDISERIIDSSSEKEKVKTNSNSANIKNVKEIPGTAKRAETTGSKFEKTASKAAGAVLMAGGAVAAVAGLAAGSTGVAVAGAVAATAGVVVTVASSNKKD